MMELVSAPVPAKTHSGLLLMLVGRRGQERTVQLLPARMDLEVGNYKDMDPHSGKHRDICLQLSERG